MASLAEQDYVTVRAADTTVDVIVIGAGPAGMAAAIEAKQHGLSVLVLDEQTFIGGQIYRSITQSDSHREHILGQDYSYGKTLAQSFIDSKVEYWPETSVWQVTQEKRVHALKEDQIVSVQGRFIVLATGAMERPFPISGWTLPGVMTAGAAQILLKSASIVPDEPPVLIGTGPLLYLLAWQYIRAGVQIQAILDTSETVDVKKAFRHLGGAIAGWRELLKGIKMLRAIRTHKIPHYREISELTIMGKDHVEEVHFISKNKSYSLPANLVLLHQGVVPNTNISWSLRAEHLWDEQQLCWRPCTDSRGQLSIPDIYMAGDGAGINGARAAEYQGHLIGLAIAKAAGRIDHNRYKHLAFQYEKARKNVCKIRPFIDALYRPIDMNRIPKDDVVVCRCEEVTAGVLRDAVLAGCTDPNRAKSFTRCGMGPCQGRQCGLTATELIAKERKVSPEDTGYYRIRPPLKPITLTELAKEAPVYEN